MIVPPGPSAPDTSAASTIAAAIRSLIDPPGFERSLLMYTLWLFPNSRLMRICGVLPMVCRTSLASLVLLRGGSIMSGALISFATMAHDRCAAKRYVPASLPGGTDALHADLADAAGRSLSARVQG